MHVHGQSRSANLTVKIALLATAALVVGEFVAGILAHSLALVSDGWHNFSDIPTLVLSWIALYFERKPPDHQKTYGYHRAGVLAAFVNALILIGVALVICYEGYDRVAHPAPVESGMMLGMGIVALVINGGIASAMASERRDLNMRAVYIHNLGDALSNVAIVAGALIIHATGQTIIDPILAFVIAALILWTAAGILRESANILLEGLPKGISLERVAATMLNVAGVREVHDVHIWSLGSQSRALSCHIRILDMPTSESERIAHHVREGLAREFGITHTTLQFEHTHEPGDFHTYMPEPAPSKTASGK